MEYWNRIWLLVLMMVGLVAAAGYNRTDVDDNNASRKMRALGVFSIVKFPNNACVGSTSMNGTCYTADECTAKGGTNSGTCASSFGVCCTFSLACGSTSSENSTYHSITTYSTTTDASPCTYTVCPSTSSDICKLRIDFESFLIAGPFTVATNPNSLITADPKVGDCVTDTFTVTAPGSTAPPTICGQNAGQHMYVDAADACNKLSFNINKAVTTTTRSWNLKVTQIECGSTFADHDCLQYITGKSGTFASFNFDMSVDTSSAITPSSTINHLSDQHYSVCFRREEKFCSLCFDSVVTGTGAIAGSFGVSASADATASQAANDATCTGATAFTDYISINGLIDPSVTSGQTLSNAAGTTADKVCGHLFGAINAGTAGVTACTFRAPFRWGVNFDGGEVVAADGTATLNALENNEGSIGFFMNYFQVAC